MPVALGHYDDKIELMEKILESEKINDGVSIILYGLNAAKQQFQVSKYKLEQNLKTLYDIWCTSFFRF